MSALGQKQTLKKFQPMSLPPKADLKSVIKLHTTVHSGNRRRTVRDRIQFQHDFGYILRRLKTLTVPIELVRSRKSNAAE